MCFLSVVIPIYNSEKYIDDLMESILAQKFQGYEVILVDDGSTDGSLACCMKYAAHHPFIKVIHTENKGVSHARNIGLKEARGEWIHFVDSDDLILENMFQTFSHVVKSQKVDLITCGCVRETAGQQRKEFCGPIEDSVYKENIQEFLRHMTMENRYWVFDYIWNKWYKKEIIQKNGLCFYEDLSLGEDFVFNTQYFQYVSSFAVVKETFYRYIIRENGLVSKFRKNPWSGREKLFENQLELYKHKGIWESNKEWLEIQAGQIAFGDLRTINSPLCKYGFREKKEFVKNVIQSKQFPMILQYLKQRKGIVFQIYYFVLNIKCEELILFLIYLEQWKR